MASSVPLEQHPFNLDQEEVWCLLGTTDLSCSSCSQLLAHGGRPMVLEIPKWTSKIYNEDCKHHVLLAAIFILTGRAVAMSTSLHE